ncbi:hypothetical protein BH10BAC1_BH10BAC1_04730 [soil metagenome]
MKKAQDNSEIYYLLETCRQLPADFSIDKVISFDAEDDFYIVFYTAKDRNFNLFKAKNYIQITDALPHLLNEIMDYSDADLYASMIDEAIRFIEDKIHSKNNSRFYFDAH